MSTQAKARSRKFHAFKRFPSVRPGRRLVCVALALNLLILPAPLTDVASRITADVETGAMGLSQTVALAWAKIRPHLFVMRIPPLDFGVPIWISSSTQAAATAPPDPSKVSSIGVTPVKHVSYVGDRVAYHAQARDAGAAVVHGIKFNYQSLTPAPYPSTKPAARQCSPRAWRLLLVQQAPPLGQPWCWFDLAADRSKPTPSGAWTRAAELRQAPVLAAPPRS
jgi:hypothetical protein